MIINILIFLNIIFLIKNIVLLNFILIYYLYFFNKLIKFSRWANILMSIYYFVFFEVLYFVVF